MVHKFCNKRITGILNVLPSLVVNYQDELIDYPFPVNQSLKLGKMMDYNTRRICYSDDSVSEYALFGINKLIDNGLLSKNDIGAIVVSSSSQDYIMPPISYIIQGKLDLSKDVICTDIVQACAGYIFGLVQSFMILDTYNVKKVVLVTGDILSKKISSRDRNSRPIIGDAVNITVIENSPFDCELFFCSKNYGNLGEYIKIPAGGLKLPSSSATAVQNIDSFGNYRSLDNFFMDGEEVFNFVMTYVPVVISEVLNFSKILIKDIDYFAFHQPNKYMLTKLSDEMEIPYEKVFSNIVGIYGNSSSGTIPLNISHNLKNILASQSLRLCLSGFGGGLTCNALIMDFAKLNFCEIIDYIIK